MSEKIEIQATHQFKATAEQIYDAWLAPDSVRAWLAAALQSMGLSGEIAQIEIDAKVGGSFLFSDMRDGVETKHRGTYLEMDRPNKLVFTWITDVSEESDPPRVIMTIQPDGDGCVVTIHHELDAKWADYVNQTVNGWTCMLQGTDTWLQR